MSIRKFLYNYPIIAIVAVLWVMVIVTFATVCVFVIIPQTVGTALATCYSSLVGLPSVAFGFYQWRMKRKEDKEIEFGKNGDNNN